MTEPSPTLPPSPSARKQFLIVMLSTVVIVPAVLFSGIGLIFFAEKTWQLVWTFEQSLHYLLCIFLALLLPLVPYFFNKAAQRHQAQSPSKTTSSSQPKQHRQLLSILVNLLAMVTLLLVYLPYGHTQAYYHFFLYFSHGLRGMLALNVLLHTLMLLLTIGLGLFLQKYRSFAFIREHDQLLGSVITSFLTCSFIAMSIDIALIATLA